jgi:hypothetical protein
MDLPDGPDGLGSCRLAYSAHRTAMGWMRLLERLLLRLHVYSLVTNTHRHDSRLLGCCLVGIIRIHLRHFRCHPKEKKHKHGVITGPAHHKNNVGAKDEGQEHRPREVGRHSLDLPIVARCFVSGDQMDHLHGHGRSW